MPVHLLLLAVSESFACLSLCVILFAFSNISSPWVSSQDPGMNKWHVRCMDRLDGQCKAHSRFQGFLSMKKNEVPR